MEMNLQLFGGRGSDSGPSLSNSSGKSINIQSETDVWSYRHSKGNEPFVDSINSSVRDMEDDFPGLMQDVNRVNAAKFGGEDNYATLGCYGGKDVDINTNYTNIDMMNTAYDNAGDYHPPRGNKNGVEAVTYHEMGHALTDHVASKIGAENLDAAAKTIVNNAYKATGGKGKNAKQSWAQKISGYAKESYAECVAEAVADWYCNGSKANANSKAIMAELKKYA